MGYHIRVLGSSDPEISLAELNGELNDKGIAGKLRLSENDSPEKWSVLEIENAKGQTLAQIERNPVVE